MTDQLDDRHHAVDEGLLVDAFIFSRPTSPQPISVRILTELRRLLLVSSIIQLSTGRLPLIHFDAQSAGSVAETTAKPLKIETSGGTLDSWGYGKGGADQ